MTPAPDKLPEREAFLTGFDVATKLLDDSIALGDPRWPEVRQFAADKFASTGPQPAVLDEVGSKCTASPDHADILETIENAADDWQTKGYASALAEVRDMANVGRAFMEALPEGYCYMSCPSEIVSDLQNERDEAASTTAAAVQAETERCAKVAEDQYADLRWDGPYHIAAGRIAAAIRSRGSSEGGAE